MKRDMLSFKRLSNVLLKMAEEGTAEIKKTFFNTAQAEIKTFAEASLVTTHKSFVDKMFEDLNQKYFWRKWFVLSYDEKRFGFENHIFVGSAKYIYYSLREYKRNIIVVHTNNINSPINTNLQSIVSDLRKSYSYYWCSAVFNFVRPRIGDFNSLVVINYFTLFAAKANTEILGYRAENFYILQGIWHAYVKVGFRVFVIAPEK